MVLQFFSHLVNEMGAILDESAVVIDPFEWNAVKISLKCVRIGGYPACPYRIESYVNKEIVLLLVSI